MIRIDLRPQNEEITAKYVNDKDFQNAFGKKLLKEVYDQINKESKYNTNPK